MKNLKRPLLSLGFPSLLGLLVLPGVLPAGSPLVATAVSAAPQPGQLLASQCFQCHGTNGRAVSGFESITGKSAYEMYKTILEMSQRPAEGIMDRQVRAYTPAQLRLIAEYLATLPAAPAAFED